MAAFGRIPGASPRVTSVLAVDLPVFAAILAALNAVWSLVTVVAIYREGGILKRLRATPLRPQTILSAHVMKAQLRVIVRSIPSARSFVSAGAFVLVARVRLSSASRHLTWERAK